jgi:ABC-type sugar transport system ATPase subunit
MAAADRASLTIPLVVAAMLGDKKPYERESPVRESPVRKSTGRANTGRANTGRANTGPESTGLAAAGESATTPVRHAAGDVTLEHVSVRRQLDDVSLAARPGEIVGLAGLAGAGQHAVLDVVCGLTRPRQGSVRLPSGAPGPRRFRAAVAQGVALVTGDRRRLGLMLDKPIWENVGQVRSVALARDGRYIRASDLRARARRQMERLGIRGSADTPAGSLSGGNQQKVVFAKWLEIEPSVLLLDDPTRGVDVGTKLEMHGLIRAEAAAGAAVLLCSTDVDELADVCDRVLVFFRHGICAELAGDALTQHRILEAMNTGATEEAA